VLAIALVLAAGVATLILGNGAQSSLEETRARYYDTYRFADVFADLTRAPLALLTEIRAIDGVVSAEARILKLGLLDLPDMPEPGTLLLVSMPEREAGGLNRLYLRQGRFPDPQAAQEAVVSESFATAHRLRPGSTFTVLMNGRQRKLVVTGIALSPEFIYALGPGELMPDPRRYGIAWLPRPVLEAAYDLEGAFSNVVLRVAPGASTDRVITTLDRLTAPYGGVGASGRKDQTSHAFLDAELKQLGAMAKILPPIFLLVAAMLVNMTLSRLITLEREQIGLLKAIGYSSRGVALHYVEFVVVISAIGILIGFVAGAWLGAGLAQLYARFFSFPFLVFSRDPQIYGVAAIVTLGAAVGGSILAVRRVVTLPPAVAMSPAAPDLYRTARGPAGCWIALRQTDVMTARHLFRWPLRTLSGILGVAMAVAILVASLWSSGSIRHMIDVTFHRAERNNAVVMFDEAQPMRALYAVRQMQGVIAAEPFRSVTARISHRNLSRKLAIIGKPPMPSLSRVLTPDLQPVAMPEAGLIISEALADALKVTPGEFVTVDFLDGTRATVSLPVSGLSLGYVGLGAAMELGALNRAMTEDRLISGVTLQLDAMARDSFFAAAKRTPATAFVMVTASTVSRFKQTLAENITIMTTVYVALATIIAVGVVYNFARIALSEQGRELASLRVLGFTRGEVSRILFAELGAIVLLAQPLGWLIGYVIGLGMVAAFSSDLYRVPYVIGREVFASASLVVIAAALVAAWAIWARIDNLDLVEVLKTRE
jgi:putative ABC transport system permease protein